MSYVTGEQIRRARECDLLTYLQRNEPQELRKCGRNEYCTVSHDSLKISNGLWNWHSRGIGGSSALDYLVNVREMEFTEAVELLAGRESVQAERPQETGGQAARKQKGETVKGQTPQAERPEVKQEKPKEVRLPETEYLAMQMTRYLQKRGIDLSVIAHCRGEGTLYEDRKHHNCIFVGRDKKGTVRYAALRGTAGDFKGELEGSDKRYGFAIPSDFGCGFELVAAESPIDALSLATMDRQDGKDWRLTNYLSLGGTSPQALIQFLKDYPDVKTVRLCLDHDKAGQVGMERIRAALEQEESLKGRKLEIRDCPPPLSCGKDYNDFLLQRNAEREAERKQNLAEKLHRGSER